MSFDSFRIAALDQLRGEPPPKTDAPSNLQPCLTEIASDMTMWRYWNIPKLVSKEDFGHFHKILGVGVLCNFLYRAYLIVAHRHMSFRGDMWSGSLILVHSLLSLSSLIFHLPNTRIKAAPMIYPEFRAHSILFAMRSLVMMALILLSQVLQSPTPLYLRGTVVVATMLGADTITNSYKDHGTTMRAMPFPEYVPSSVRKHLNTFYSISQLFATANCVFAGPEEAFMALFPIQVAALLMTCVRKSIISAGAWHYYYALALLTNYALSPITSSFRTEYLMEHGYPVGKLFVACSVTVIYLRIFFPKSVNKYVLWGTVAALHLISQYCFGWYTFYPQYES